MELKFSVRQLFQSRIKDAIRLCTVIVGGNDIYVFKLVNIKNGQKHAYMFPLYLVPVFDLCNNCQHIYTIYIYMTNFYMNSVVKYLYRMNLIVTGGSIMYKRNVICTHLITGVKFMYCRQLVGKQQFHK